jgi:hypothetical protein
MNEEKFIKLKGVNVKAEHHMYNIARNIGTTNRDEDDDLLVNAK